MVSVMNEPHFHKKIGNCFTNSQKDYDTKLLQNRQFINNTHCTRAAARKCSTKLLVLSKVF